MNKPSAKEILKHLKQKYFVVDLEKYEIVQSNNLEVKIGGDCYQEIFHFSDPCCQQDKNCICKHISENENEIVHYFVQDDGLDFSVFNISPLSNEDNIHTHLLVQQSHGKELNSSSPIFAFPGNDNAIAILSPNGQIWYANEQASLSLSDAKQSVANTNISSYITPGQMKKMQALFSQVVKSNQPLQQEIEVHFTHKLRWFFNRMEPILFGPNLEPAVLSISHDITDRILIENVKHRSDLNFKIIADHITDVIWKLDIKTLSYTYFSPAIYQMRGITVHDAMQESLAESIHPNDFFVIKKVLEQYRKGSKTPLSLGKSRRFIVRQYHKNGSLIWVEVTINILKDDEGLPVEILGISRDITQSRNKKEQLLKSLGEEKFYANIIRDSSQAIFLRYLDGKCQALNRAAYELLGYNEQEATSLNWRDVLTPKKWLEQEKLMLDYALQSKQTITYEKEYYHKDGHAIPLKLLVHPKFDHQGEFKFFIDHITDLSEIQQTKKQLKEHEDRFKYAQMASNDGIWEWDMTSGNLYMSPRYLEMLGYKNGEIPQKYSTFEKLIHPDDIHHVLDIHQEYFNNEIHRFEAQFRMKHKDGHWVPILSRSYKILDQSGIPVRLVGTHIDLTEIHIVQGQLKLSQERFKLLSQLTSEGILIHEKGIALDANKALLDMLECSLEDILGKNMIDMYSTEEARPIYYENLRNDSTETYRAEVKSGNGRVFPVDVKGKMMTLNGKVVRVVSIVDVSQRLEAEKMILKLSAVVEQGANSVIITNTKGEIEYVNTMFMQLTGYSSEEVIGKTPRILKSGRIPESVYQNLWDTVSAGEVWEGELLNKRKNGQLFWINSTITPIKDSKEVITHYVGINLDITQKKHDRKKLDDLTKRLRLAVRAANFGIWDVDLDSRGVFWDEKMHEIYELSPSAKTAKYSYFKEVVDEQDWMSFQEIIDGGYIEDELYEIDLKIYPHGKMKYIKNLLMFSSAGTEKNNKRLVGITYDITKQKEAEQELIREKEKAKENDKLKSAFLANMSHEIRTPLNGIIGFTDLLRDDELESSAEEKRNFLNVIYNNGQILLQLVNDIIDLSKIETGQLVVNMMSLSLDGLIKKACLVFEQQIAAKGLHFTTPKDSGVIKVWSDSTRVHQIFINLLGNAVKFTTKGFVEVGYEDRDHDVLLWVRDSGVGISKKAQKFIFERFAQGQPVRDQLLGGTGLGLSITKGLVKLLGGKIWMESVVNQGTTFFFTLPKK